MLNSRIIQIVTAVGSGLAMLALSVLPAEHVHRSDSGPSVVHRHVIDADNDAHHDSHAADLQASGDHGDHADAETLTATFVAERQYVALAPLVVAIFLFQAPEPQSIVREVVDDVPLAHGPPIRLLALRGPPLSPAC